MKRLLAITCMLCLVYLCACGAQPSAEPTEESASVPAETQSVSEITETQSQTEAQTEAMSASQTEPAAPQPANLSVAYADNMENAPGVVRVTAAAGEPSVQMAFTTDQKITDVQILSLMMQDFDEDTGKPVFDVTTVETVDTLTPAQTLVVTTVFYGDLPNNGIAYTDADGSTHRFSVEMSGEDGTLLLTEF